MIKCLIVCLIYILKGYYFYLWSEHFHDYHDSIIPHSAARQGNKIVIKLDVGVAMASTFAFE